MRVKDIFTAFEQDHMYDADTRRRMQVLIHNYYDVVMCSNLSTPFDRLLAGYAIDKWTEYEGVLWQK